MIEIFYEKLDGTSKLKIRAALANPDLRDFFKLLAMEFDKAYAGINSDATSEEIAAEYRRIKANSMAYHDLSQFTQKLIVDLSQQK